MKLNENKVETKKVNCAKKKSQKFTKKSKKNWRKYIDVSDIPLESVDALLEKRTGVNVKKNLDSYFTIDTVARGNPILSQKKLNRIDKLHKKIFSLNEPVKKKTLDEIRAGLTQRKEEKRIRHENLQKLTKKNKEKKLKKDSLKTQLLWDGKEEEKKNSTVSKSLIDQRESCKLPSIDLPHPGLSYRPEEKDRQNHIKRLIPNALDVEYKEKEIILEKPQLLQAFSQSKQNFVQDLYNIQFNNEEEKTKDEELEEDIDICLLTSEEKELLKKRREKKQKRKSKTERNRIEKVKLIKKSKANLREKIRLGRLNKNVLQITEEVENSLKERKKMNEEKREKKKKFEETKTKKLGKFKFVDEEKRLSVMNLEEDATNSLKNMKTNVNLLEDRYYSLQKRNIIEPRKKLNKKRNKRRIKYTLKKGL
ncbi:hypothetical protein SNEBB_003206 [Seison nebaliae]|nr:hypothetical protein SNEBB_003206 [Seison nebaliae]